MTEELASRELMDEILRLAAERDHRISPSMFSQRLRPGAALAVLGNLRRCPLRLTGAITGIRDAVSEPVVLQHPPEEAAMADRTCLPPAPSVPLISTFTDVPDGYYATASRSGHNDLDFWKVERPSEGKWAGRTFVRRVIGGKPDANTTNMQARLALLAIRQAGPEAAGLLYATELGLCRRCNRHLTDEESRRLGIGPYCRAK